LLPRRRRIEWSGAAVRLEVVEQKRTLADKDQLALLQEIDQSAGEL
jgi:hypothetical protein